jgi:hypothetical protein
VIDPLTIDPKSITIESTYTPETIKISRAEYLLIQQLRAIRKKSIAIIDVGGDGSPKTFRAIEACIVDLR